jgi:phosphate transport system substrate-binding protein
MAGALIVAPAQAQTTVVGGGATFPQIFIEACQTGYNASQRDYTMNYQGGGSGRGRTNFVNGSFRYAATDVPFASTETRPTWNWTYVPFLGGAITIPVNLKGTAGKPIGGALQIKQSTLAKIFGGQITTWNSPEILSQNAKIKKLIPATPITIVYRSESSGTTDNFLQYLNAWQPTIFTKVQGSMASAFPGGNPPTNSIAGAANQGVMAAVAGKDGAIGYVDLGDAQKAKATVAAIQNGLGEFVKPTTASTNLNLDGQTNVNQQGLVQLDYFIKSKGAYPLSIFTYYLGRIGGATAGDTASKAFLRYMLDTCGPAQASGLGYVPLQGKVLASAQGLAAKVG